MTKEQKAYIQSCARRALEEWIRMFRRDPFFQVGPKFHNPDGTLIGMIWLAAQSGNSWLLDFEEYFQRCFPIRGSYQFCRMLLEKQNHPIVSFDTFQLLLSLF